MHIFKATSGHVWSRCNMGFAVCAVQPSVHAPNLSTWMRWQEFASQSRFIARTKLGIFYISRCLGLAKSWNRCGKKGTEAKMLEKPLGFTPPLKKKHWTVVLRTLEISIKTKVCRTKYFCDAWHADVTFFLLDGSCSFGFCTVQHILDDTWHFQTQLHVKENPSY